MSPLARLRNLTLLGTIVLGGLTAGLLWQPSPPAGHGVLLGCLGALLPFYALTWRMERVVSQGEIKIQSEMARWAIVRYVLYVVVLVRGFYLDPVHIHGLLGALVGLFLVKLVLAAITLSGLDTKPTR